MNLKLNKNLKFKIKNYYHLIIGTVLVVLVPLALITLQRPDKALASWYDDNWLFRKAVTVTVSSSASDIKDLETLLTVDTTGITASLQTNCEDLRFTNQTGDILPFYAPSCSDNSATNKVWVLADLVPKNTTTYTTYMYYGNPSAPAASDSQKFRLFNSLVGYWALNESSWNGTSGEVKDSSVNSNNGTRVGDATTTSSGKYNYGGTFDGTGDYAEISAAPVSGNGDYTLSIWVKPTDLNSHYGVISQFDGPGSASEITAINVAQTTGLVTFVTYTGGGYSNVASNGAISAGQWSHLVVVKSGTTGSIYINGAFDKSGTVANIGTTNTVRLGARENALAAYPTYGSLDDARMYNRALSAAEISQLYSTPGTIASTANATVKPSTSFATEEKAPGPAAYWGFDEGTGTNTNDSTTNNNDGTITGATWQPEDMCVAGKCLSFDRSDDNVAMGNPTALQITGTTMTMSAWINPSSLSASYNQVIMAKDNRGDGIGRAYSFWVNTTGSLVGNFNQNDSTTLQVSTGVVLTPNTWYYVVAVLESGSSAKIYVNGINRTDTTTGSITSIQNASVDFMVGSGRNSGNTGTAALFGGKIDDVKIYPYARTAAQVLTDYNSRGSSKGASSTLGSASNNNPAALSNGLVGYWKMDDAGIDAEGETSTDSSGNGNNGTLYGDNGVGDNGTGMTCTNAGQFGTGCDFDGTDDYVDASTVTTNNLFDGAFTVSAWAKLSDWSTNKNIFGAGRTSSSTEHVSLDFNTSDKKFYIRTTNQGGDPHYNQVGSINTYNNDSAWHFFTIVVDASSYINHFYIDNIDQGSNSNEVMSIPNINKFYIGQLPWTSSNINPWQGQIDEVRIYNKVLSPAEVSQLYNFAPGPVGYWNFEEGSGTSANDTSTNARTGTLNGGSTWTSGKYGKGVKVDGVSGSNVSVPDFSY